MDSFEQLMIAVKFSYESMTWITWLVLIFGFMKAIQVFIKAYENNDTYAQMRSNEDKTGIVQFYYGVIISILSIFIFFLPYFMNYNG